MAAASPLVRAFQGVFMSFFGLRHAAAAAAVAFVLSISSVVSAAPGGTYVIDGGGYSIELRTEGDNLVVVEPNKTSTYVRQADGSFHFTNPNNGILYGIRVIDDSTIEAFKPGSDGAPTVLKRFGTPGGATNTDVASSEQFEAIANKYLELSQSDPDNAQTHSACAALALKRSQASKDEADAYAVQMAAMIRQLLVDPSVNPCPDVFLSW